jgi:ligand-binding sensor protein
MKHEQVLLTHAHDPMSWQLRAASLRSGEDDAQRFLGQTVSRAHSLVTYTGWLLLRRPHLCTTAVRFAGLLAVRSKRGFDYIGRVGLVGLSGPLKLGQQARSPFVSTNVHAGRELDTGATLGVDLAAHLVGI